ncbi:hypothetical protein COLO4_30259 [Corchorus olitorius]|uniref:Uncharacterized protein n=1 Tax=Corchorus olitorius TaxID=93759 RepID=A0A1R3H9M9_9ROSI|nr:hypothetical protein COLO4_30259 [Corchorus olitorius]
MVTSREWTNLAYAKDRIGKKFVDLVLDSTFWKECAVIVKLTKPLVWVFRIVAIQKAREEIVKRFQRRKKRVEPYLKILDNRWDNQLHKNLHAAGYWLNPKNQYDIIEMVKHRHTISGLLDVIERYSHGNSDLRSKLTSEVKIFKNAQGDFGRISAISDRDVMLPGRNYDPIDFEDFAENGEWILEEEPTTLSPEELEAFNQELASCNISTQNLDDLNLEDVLNEDDDNELEDINETFGNTTSATIFDDEFANLNSPN